MPRRPVILAASCGALFAATLGLASPALAHDGRHDDREPSWKTDRHHGYGVDPAAREHWLAECRRRVSRHDSGLGGAVIGGLAGGIAGHAIAGRGDHTEGTIAGAVLGAAAGAAIDKTEDRGRVRDECEAALDDYYARGAGGYYGHGYPQAGYAYQGYGYGGGCCGYQPMIMVPIQRIKRADPECEETVEEVVEYVDAPVRRAAPRRAAPVKRTKIVPDKRIRIK